ncbi:hypothetical protein GLYMA_20G074000v4 [Glycine max]|nr:hypothetical protein GLYMA_20G074000v4 [Glycine max]KAH1034999.1 hypothetical protein GYH30_055123 [Glycine max]
MIEIYCTIEFKNACRIYNSACTTTTRCCLLHSVPRTSLIQSNQRVALPSVDVRGRIMRSGEADREMEMGSVVVEKVGGRSSVTSCFSRYPLKFVIPKKVGSSKTDAVWVYALNYGGGIVSGDNISCKFSVGDTCTMVLTTQGSTKVYKSVGSKCSQQILEKQVFCVLPDSNLVMVDWITSGRHESGEKWDFDLYRSSNNIFLEDGQPLFLDTMLLDKEKIGCVQEHMHNYQVIAMIVLLGCSMSRIVCKIT